MLTKRLSDREREMEEDAQDKRKEAEEISILRKKLVEENHTSPDAAITTVRLCFENFVVNNLKKKNEAAVIYKTGRFDNED